MSECCVLAHASADTERSETGPPASKLKGRVYHRVGSFLLQHGQPAKSVKSTIAKL